MTISFREIADRCDAFDEEVAAITEARKEFWAEVRDQLPARDVKALKAAIKLRKRRRVDLDGEEDHDQRTAEILLEIEHGTDVANIDTRRRAARGSEDQPAHDPNTGEILDIGIPISPINSETHREPSNRDVSADGEAYSAAASQGQAAHAGTGSETLASHEGDTQGEGASALSPSTTNGGDHEVATNLKSSDNGQFLDEPSGADTGSAVEAGAQVSQSGVASRAPAAPVERSPSRDAAPGAPHSGEMPDLPAIFDRRRISEAAA